MKAKIRIIFFSIALAGAPSLRAQETIQNIVRAVKPSVVTIFCEDSSGRLRGQGTAFFIDSGMLVTSRHVVEHAINAFCKDRNNNRFSVTGVIAESSGTDLVLLQTLAPAILAPPLKVSSEKAEEGERVIVIGTPLGMELSVTDGIVSSIRKVPGVGTILQISAPISEGSSGGPVVNLKGEVVGIVCAKNGEGENLNFALPVSALHSLKKINPVSLSEWARHALAAPMPAPVSASGPEEEFKRKFIAEFAFGRGLDHFRQKNWGDAIDKFSTALGQNQNYPEAWRYLGRSELAIGHFDHARTALENAVRLDPRNLDSHYYLGMAYFMLGRFDEASRQCLDALKIDSTFGLAYNGLGRTALAKGHPSDAIDFFRKALACDPRLLESRFFLGEVLLEKGKLDEAEKHFQVISSIDSNYSLLWQGWGILAYAKGNFPGAISAFDRAIRLDSSDPVAYNGKGRSLVRLSRSADAVGPLKRAVELEGGTSIQFILDLGEAQERSGNHQAAHEIYTRAIAVDPDIAESHFRLGMNAAIFLHDNRLALSEYKILQKLNAAFAKELFNQIYAK